MDPRLILATIYCPNGNPSLRLFRMINTLSKQVILLGDFNSKHKQFGCVKPNKSGQTLLNIAKDLKLFYVNRLGPNRHTCEDPVHGTSDILDMAFITPGLNSRDISSSVVDDHMGSDHFPIQILIDKPLKRNTTLTEPRYQLDKTNYDLLHNTLKDSLTNIDTNITTQDELEELAVTFCDKLMKAVDTSTPNKTNDLILNLTPENVTQHSRIVTTTRKGSSRPTKMSKIIGRYISVQPQ